MVARKSVLKPAPVRPELESLIEQAKRSSVTDVEINEQRVSFAYGNAPADAERITKESARQASTRYRLCPA